LGSFKSSFNKEAHLLPNKTLEYHKAPITKYASVATKMASQFMCEKISVFIIVDFGLKGKAMQEY